MFRNYLVGALFMLASSVTPGFADEMTDNVGSHPFVVSGVVANQSSVRLLSGFVKWLSAQSGYPMYIKYATDYTELSQIFREDPHAIGWNCGASFVEDRAADGQQLISVPLFQGAPLYHSLVLAQSERRESGLIDFKAQILAYSDPRSNSGFVAPSVALKRQGIDIHEHFYLLLNAGNHEGAIEALINGLADVAAVDEYIWVEYQKTHPEASGKLKELERFGPFPFTPIVAGKQVASDLIERMQTALAGMASDQHGSKLLQTLGLDGFVTQSPDFYAPIQKNLNFLGENK